MPYCNETTVSRETEGGKVALSVRCFSWSCPDCSSVRKRALIAQAIGGGANIFLTLTSRVVPGQQPIAAAKKLAHAWRLVRLRIMRRYKWRKLPFIAVFEKTLNDWPHLHILLRSAFIDQHFVSECMKELTNSPIVKFRAIDNRSRLAGYVAKYCGQDSHKFGTCKRYWQTRDYDLRPPPKEKVRYAPGFGWDRETITLHRWKTAFHHLGWTVVALSHWQAEARRPP